MARKQPGSASSLSPPKTGREVQAGRKYQQTHGRSDSHRRSRWRHSRQSRVARCSGRDAIRSVQARKPSARHSADRVGPLSARHEVEEYPHRTADVGAGTPVFFLAPRGSPPNTTFPAGSTARHFRQRAGSEPTTAPISNASAIRTPRPAPRTMAACPCSSPATPGICARQSRNGPNSASRKPASRAEDGQPPSISKMTCQVTLT